MSAMRRGTIRHGVIFAIAALTVNKAQISVSNRAFFSIYVKGLTGIRDY